MIYFVIFIAITFMEHQDMSVPQILPIVRKGVVSTPLLREDPLFQEVPPFKDYD